MAGMQGADIAQLRRVGAQFHSRGEQLRRLAASLSAQLSASPWEGGDAARFRREWSDQHRPAMLAACTGIEGAAKLLARNADEQERASSANGQLGGGASAAPGHVKGRNADAMTPPTRSVGPFKLFGGSIGPFEVPATAAENRAWWDSLTPTEQAAVLAEHPERIGNLDGLPGTVRDEANRTQLADELAKKTEYVRTHPLDFGAKEDLDGLRKLDTMMSQHPDYQLLLLDDSGHPLKAAVANGNIDDADRIIAHVPGTTSNVSGMPSEMDRVNHLTNETVNQLAQHGDQTSKVVGIDWQGYDAPDEIYSKDRLTTKEGIAGGLAGAGGGAVIGGLLGGPVGALVGGGLGAIVGDGVASADPDADPDVQDALNPRFAHDGAPAFASFGDGLRVNGGDDVRIVADAHSYGAAVAGGAAQQTDAFDALVTSGGPGVFADNANQLHLKDGLFVSEAPGADVIGDGDIVPDIGQIDLYSRFGKDPSDLPGAHVFDDHGVGGLKAPTGHSQYWDEGTVSLYNDAAVVAGYPNEAHY